MPAPMILPATHWLLCESPTASCSHSHLAGFQQAGPTNYAGVAGAAGLRHGGRACRPLRPVDRHDVQPLRGPLVSSPFKTARATALSVNRWEGRGFGSRDFVWGWMGCARMGTAWGWGVPTSLAWATTLADRDTTAARQRRRIVGTDSAAGTRPAFSSALATARSGLSVWRHDAA